MTKAGNLYLVGFMGAGKTAVGRRVAELLGRPFWDLDREIEKSAGIGIPEIFQRLGEAHFRLLEKKELLKFTSLRNVVVALGGGAFCNDENQAILSGTGMSVWLDAPLDLLIKRCCGDHSARPLLAAREEMERLLEKRRHYYEKASLTLGTAGLEVEDLARQILREWEKLTG